MLNHYKMMTKTAGKMGSNMKRMDPRNMQNSMAQMQQALPPGLLQQMQAGGGMQEMMKAMGGLPGMPPGGLPKGMKGMPGMPF